MGNVFQRIFRPFAPTKKFSQFIFFFRFDTLYIRTKFQKIRQDEWKVARYCDY